MNFKATESVVNGAELAEYSLSIPDWVIVPGICVKTVQCLHLGLAEVEVEDRDVFDEALESGGFGDGDSTSLNSPSEKDLGWGLVVSSSDVGNSLLDEQGLFICGQVKLDVRDGTKVTEGHHLKTILTSHSQENFL